MVGVAGVAGGSGIQGVGDEVEEGGVSGKKVGMALSDLKGVHAGAQPATGDTSLCLVSEGNNKGLMSSNKIWSEKGDGTQGPQKVCTLACSRQPATHPCV